MIIRRKTWDNLIEEQMYQASAMAKLDKRNAQLTRRIVEVLDERDDAVQHMASLQNRNAALMDQLYVERRGTTDAELSVLMKISNAHAEMLANTRNERENNGPKAAE